MYIRNDRNCWGLDALDPQANGFFKVFRDALTIFNDGHYSSKIRTFWQLHYQMNYNLSVFNGLDIALLW
jgi:hypothetical protein